MKLEKILDGELIKINRENLEELIGLVSGKGENHNVTFILGSGVSAPAKLPNWNKLIAKMWGRIIETDIYDPEGGDEIEADTLTQDRIGYTKASQRSREEIRRDCGECLSIYRDKVNMALDGEYQNLFAETNLLEGAEYIYNYVRQNLWINKAEKREHLCNEIVNEILQDSIRIEDSGDLNGMDGSALYELAGLLNERKGKKPCNVITYNYDNLLEYLLMKGTVEPPVIICNYDKEKVGEEGRVNIYHPHGFIKVTEDGIEKENTEKVILTESSYYEAEQKVYRWENSIQARAFLDTSCVFIGFSGQDYNFRRMLKNIPHDEKQHLHTHFIFFCVDRLVEQLLEKEFQKWFEEQRKTAVTALMCREIPTGGSTDPEKKAEELWHRVDECEKNLKRKYIDGGEEKKEILETLILKPECAYERMQLLYILYAQYMYWTGYGIIPIWSTYEELPQAVKRLRGMPVDRTV